MGLSPASLLADAWRAFRRDRELVLAIAGAFWFLPTFAVLLLVPGPPLPAAGIQANTPEATRYLQQLSQWGVTEGGWYLLRAIVDAWGTASFYHLYVDARRPDLRTALEGGVRLLPRFLLLSAMVSLLVLAGLALWVVPGIWLLARLLPAGPALVAERPLGAAAALGRGWRLSRGAGLVLIGPVGLAIGLGWLVPQPFLMLDGWLRARPGGANEAAVALVDALAAGAEAAAATVSALLAVAGYRALAGRGTSRGT